MKRIVEEEKCGVVFKSNDYKDFAKSILSVYIKDIGYGENGKKAVQERYYWDLDEKRLLKVVNKYNNPHKSKCCGGFISN